MKKTGVIFVSLLLCIGLLCSCDLGRGISVNGVKISSGVYEYFKDEAASAQPEGDDAEIEAAADAKLSQYVAINSEFYARGLTLSASEKADLSAKVNALWHLFGAYYTEIGVSKQELYKVQENAYYKDCLMADYYAAGENAVSEEALKQYFAANYIAFTSVTDYLTAADENGNPVPLTAQERTAILDRFTAYASEINDDSSIEEVGNKLDGAAVATETVVVEKGDARYPEGFFEKVASSKVNEATAFLLGDYAFIVRREDVTDAEKNLFAAYKTACLKAYKGAEFEELVANRAAEYTVEK